MNASFDEMNLFLKQVDWSPVLQCSDVNVAYDIWHTIVESAMERFIPRVQSTSRLGNKPWYSPLLRRVARQRDRLFCKAKLLPRDHRLSVTYRKVRNWYVSELRAAERQYYLRLGSYLSSS